MVRPSRIRAIAQVAVLRPPGPENSPFPTQRGTPLAKDVWMMGIGLGLVIDDVADRLNGDG